MSPELRKIMLENGPKLKIGWKICNYKDYQFIMRCYHCSGFGHKADNCSQSNPSCGHCGGDHNLKDCKTKKERHFCVNCHSYKEKNQSKVYSTKHSSLDKDCQTFRKMMSIVISKTNYG